MLEVFKVAVNRPDVEHLYYSEGVAKTTKNCVIVLDNNTVIKREVIPILYCTDKAGLKEVGHLAYDMTKPDGEADNTARIEQMRQSSSQVFPE